MRGRIIQKFIASIARLDEASTGAVVEGGWDPDFHEPKIVDDGTQLGNDSKRFHDPINLMCQLDRKSWGAVDSTRGGQQKTADIIICLHWPELQKRGLIDSNGKAIFRRGDKIIEILTKKGELDVKFDDPPGLFIRECERAGHGLSAFGTPKTNLLYVYCDYDEEGIKQ